MKYLYLLVFTLFLIAGCSSDADKAQWEEFWKDLRGDNMKMQYDNSAALGGMDRPSLK